LQLYSQPLAHHSPRTLDTQAKLLWRLGETDKAEALRRQIAALGYARKESIPIWDQPEDTPANVASARQE
jgi:hypothetical protein